MHQQRLLQESRLRASKQNAVHVIRGCLFDPAECSGADADWTRAPVEFLGHFESRQMDLYASHYIYMHHLTHVQGYVYVEAEKEAHVREAMRGLRTIFASRVGIVWLTLCESFQT